ncbi:MAG TPA: hypothetical protein VGS12_10000 [Caulobacteraceae bacterium]|nr:hypothetical protein [Caulobacteraceae bacterium]
MPAEIPPWGSRQGLTSSGETALPPIFFVHISKTGGSSLAAALRIYWDPGDVLTGPLITTEFVQQVEPALDRPVLLHGHPGPGVLSRIPERMRLVTVLRRPADHAVSNYLHIGSRPDHPLHGQAAELGLGPFLRRHWPQAVVQTTSLLSALSAKAVHTPADVASRFAEAATLLDRCFFVGVLEQPKALARNLSDRLGLPLPFVLPRLNSAPERANTDRRIADLGTEYELLRADDLVGPLIAVEEALYSKALALCAPEARSRRSAGTLWIPANRFSAGEHARLEGGAWRVRLDGRGHVIWGPYLWPPAGRYVGEFAWSFQGPKRRRGGGALRFEVVSRADRCLAFQHWRGGDDIKIELDFDHAHPDEPIEFRVAGDGLAGDGLQFEGVQLRAQ